ncbi:unnamed protein product [Blepharisma stoltei]|uniref:TFIIS N-terminal domain-containing protein n=1 Tax=Blepharisma stoltei TaxID=1481888 RepID=A0AAU9I6F4_9CILI|nr:unnamed protein product [Blepharisma stoltei]
MSDLSSDSDSGSLSPKHEEPREPKEPYISSDSSNESSEESQEEAEKQIQSEAEEEVEFIANLTKKKGLKRKRSFDDNEQVENLVDTILKEMMQAVDEDISANQDGHPALSKLKMLDKVIKFLTVSKYHDLFLEMNGSLVLSKWLAQSPDGSFPSTPIKEGLLQVMQDIPIQTKNLEESGLGKSVMAIYQNPNETLRVKKLAKHLIDKWSRMIYEIDIDYASLGGVEENEDSDVPVTQQNKVTLNKILHNNDTSAFTRIPDKGLFDFKYRPPPRASEEMGHSQPHTSETISRLKKRLQMKKKGKKRATGNMSVDGRSLY